MCPNPPFVLILKTTYNTFLNHIIRDHYKISNLLKNPTTFMGVLTYNFDNIFERIKKAQSYTNHLQADIIQTCSKGTAPHSCRGNVEEFNTQKVFHGATKRPIIQLPSFMGEGCHLIPTILTVWVKILALITWQITMLQYNAEIFPSEKHRKDSKRTGRLTADIFDREL